jgi:hypothetical protein
LLLNKVKLKLTVLTNDSKSTIFANFYLKIIDNEIKS